MRRRVLGIVGPLALAIIWTAVSVPFVDMVRRAWLLRIDRATIFAEVTGAIEANPGRRSSNPRYRVNYRFVAGKPPRWYTHTDVLNLAEGVPAGVPKGTWDDARRTGSLKVSYVRSNPAINIPADTTPLDGIVCPALALSFSGALALGHWALTLRNLRRLRADSKP